MRVPLARYLTEGTSKVYSLVAMIPFTPIDIDVGRLVRGEWDAIRDRFRLWFIPKIEGRADKPVCYFTIRKFDQQNDVLVFIHVLLNLDTTLGSDGRQTEFTVGILSNDDVRARAALGALLDNPPSFHKRREIRLGERRWRTDPQVLMRFRANLYSVESSNAHGGVWAAKVNGPAALDTLAQLKQNMGGWWELGET